MRDREQEILDAEVGDRIAGDQRVAANERRRLTEARRQITADGFDRRFAAWVKSDVPEAERSIGWSRGWTSEPEVTAADDEADVPDEAAAPEYDFAEAREKIRNWSTERNVLAAVAKLPDRAPADEHPAAAVQHRAIVRQRAAIAAVVAEARAGIEVTVDEPKRLGGPPRVDVERVRQLAAAGKTASEIATVMGHARESIRCVARRHRITIRRASPSEAGRAGGIAKAAAQEAAC